MSISIYILQIYVLGLASICGDDCLPAESSGCYESGHQNTVTSF
jgi:hypothetical protein